VILGLCALAKISIETSLFVVGGFGRFAASHMSELFFARPFQLGFLSTKVGLFRLLLPSGFGRITASQR